MTANGLIALFFPFRIFWQGDKNKMVKYGIEFSRLSVIYPIPAIRIYEGHHIFNLKKVHGTIVSVAFLNRSIDFAIYRDGWNETIS